MLLIVIYNLFLNCKHKNLKTMRNNKRGNLQPSASSIILHLQPILALRNIVFPTAYLIKIGINSSTANKMLKGEAVQLNFRQMTALCVNLNCTPNDLFALRQMHLADNHQLLQLQKQEDKIENPYSFFEGKSVAEIKAILKDK